MIVTCKEAKAAFQTTKAFRDTTIEWIKAANIVDAYLNQPTENARPEPHPDDVLRNEIAELLLRLDETGDSCHWILGPSDGDWVIVHGTYIDGYKLLDGQHATFLSLPDLRDKILELVNSPQPSPEDELEKERTARRAAEGLAKTRGQQREELGLRINELEDKIGEWIAKVANRNATITRRDMQIEVLRATSVPKEALHKLVEE